MALNFRYVQTSYHMDLICFEFFVLIFGHLAAAETRCVHNINVRVGDVI